MLTGKAGKATPRRNGNFLFDMMHFSVMLMCVTGERRGRYA